MPRSPTADIREPAGASLAWVVVHLLDDGEGTPDDRPDLVAVAVLIAEPGIVPLQGQLVFLVEFAPRGIAVGITVPAVEDVGLVVVPPDIVAGLDDATVLGLQGPILDRSALGEDRPGDGQQAYTAGNCKQLPLGSLSFG